MRRIMPTSLRSLLLSATLGSSVLLACPVPAGAAPAAHAVLTSPVAGSTVSLGQTLTFAYSTGDIGSGTVSSSATLDGTAVLAGTQIKTDTLGPGPHTVVVTVIDKAGNTSSTTFTFEVRAASPANLVAAVNDGVATGKIAPVLQGPLNGILGAAQAALNAGLKNLARSLLVAFEAAVTVGRNAGLITPSYAALLIAWSADLRAHI